jgi:flagellar biosynthesis/type III secretory pathway protein FliH
MADPKVEAPPAGQDPAVPEPTQAEIDAWAASEKRRREAWLQGPTAEEREAYAQRLRQRRLADAFDEGETRIADGVQQGLRYGREAQLAAEGAMTLFYRWSRRAMAELVRAGREWEEETSLPNRRRRVSLDDEES